MSLFTKLFKKKKNNAAAAAQQESNLAFADNLSAWDDPLPLGIPFDKSQLRIVVFRESEYRGRQVLFDSAALKAFARTNSNDPDIIQSTSSRRPSGASRPGENATNSTSLDEQRRAVAQVMRQSRSDVKMFGEMIFGSIPITVRSVITKVHELRSPPQLMLTKLYPVFVPVAKNGDSGPDEVAGSRLSESRSSISSEDSGSIHSPPGLAHSTIPERLHRRSSAGPSPSLTPSHSSSSLSSLPFSPPKSFANGGSSFQRRYQRHRVTSIDTGVKAMLNADVENEPKNGYLRAKKTVIAVAFLIYLPESNLLYKESFHEFFFTHTPLFEYSLNLFKARLEVSLTEKSGFRESATAAFEDFTGTLTGFITAPRLPQPLWLVIATEKILDESYIPVLRLRLVDTLAALVSQHDTKETQFFLSRALTAVLTGHLGWISTVTPSNSQTAKYRVKHEPGWAQPLAKSHPYNPLWAQLGDMFGCVGSPLRITKTVLVSKNQSLLNTYLHVLSYFIRTSDVSFHRFEPVTVQNSQGLPDFRIHNVTPQNPRMRQHQSGDNQRSGTWLNKSKRTSGTRSRLASMDDQLRSRASKNPSGVYCSQDSRDAQSVKSLSRNSTAENFPTLTSSHSMGGLSGVASRSSITEESSVFFESSTDDGKLQTVCEVAAQLFSNQTEFRRRRYTMLDRQDAFERSEKDINNFIQSLPKQPRQKTISISKATDKPVVFVLQEAPISKFQAAVVKEKFSDQAFENSASFATSLMAAPSSRYIPHFALQGCTSVDMDSIAQDLRVAAENAITDEQYTEAAAIVIDLDNFTVKMVTATAARGADGIMMPIADDSRASPRVYDCHASNFITVTLESLEHLWRSRTIPEFCLMYLEERLQELYGSSRSMTTFIRNQSTVDTKDMMELLGLDMSDFPLALAVASTLAPDLIADLSST